MNFKRFYSCCGLTDSKVVLLFNLLLVLKALGGSWNNAERSCGRNSSASVICSKESLHKTIREWQSYLRTLDGVYGTIGMQGSLGR